ncbi:unnamed protein product, partial [Ilex paraguariensis]
VHIPPPNEKLPKMKKNKLKSSPTTDVDDLKVEVFTSEDETESVRGPPRCLQRAIQEVSKTR